MKSPRTATGSGEHGGDGERGRGDGGVGSSRRGRSYGLTEERCRRVRTLTTGGIEPPGRLADSGPTLTDPAGEHHLVIVPGLGALGYLVPLVRELGWRGIRGTLLDLPGFGRGDGPGGLGGGCGSNPTVPDVAAAVAAWCAGLPGSERPVVLFGHSTGAQAALLAAIQLQERGRPPAALVLAGPTVAPNQRSLARLLATAPMAYRRDPPAELGALGDIRRGGRDVLTLLRSAIADRPERTVRDLTVPLLVTAGLHDAFAPTRWLVALTHAAASRSTRVVRLPGSHNNPFTHPSAMAALVESVMTEAARVSTINRRCRDRRSGVAGRRVDEPVCGPDRTA